MNYSPQPQNKKWIAFLVIWVVTSCIGIYVRLYPLFYHTSYSASEQASMLVITSLRKTILQKIEQEHPNLSALEKQKLLNSKVNTIIHGQNIKVRQTIDLLAKSIDEKFTGKSSFPYLLASDSYYYFDLTQNIVKTGKISDKIQGSKYFNPKMSAPLGYWEPINLHPYVGYGVYKFLDSIHPGIPLMFGVSFTPLVMTMICLVPFLLICFYWRCHPFVSFLSAVFFVMAPIFIKRSTFAWYDDDSYSLFFPLMTLWIVFMGLRQRQDLKTMLLWAMLACLSLSLYALFWHGWVFLLSVILISAVILVPLNHWILKRKTQTKNLLLFFGLIALGTLLGISIVFGPAEFFVLFQEGWKALNDFLNPRLSLWPDLYIAVGELLRAPLATTVNLAGGWLFLGLALWGLGISLIRLFKKDATDLLTETVIIGTLFLFTTVMALGAQRFILLWVVPLSVLFPLGLKYIFDWGQDRWQKKFSSHHLSKKIFWGLVVVLGLGLGSWRVHASYLEVPTLLNKIFNDVWAKTLDQIKQKTPAESIVNTWWPPGHFIKAMADRRVTFDGATINKPQAYWLANVFMSSDERRAAGLLRMLNDSANEATEYLQGLGFRLSKAVQLLKDITPLNEKKAREKIGALLNEEQTNHLLSLTHKPPPPSYLLIYNELVENNIQLSFVGNWDFEKAERFNQDPHLRTRLPSKHSKDYVSFLWNMSGGMPRYSEILNLQEQAGDTLLFDQNVKINLDDMLAQVNSPKFGTGTPLSIFYEQDGRVIEKVFPRANLDYSVLYSRRDDQQQCVLLDRNIAKSLLIQMYFFEGKGLRYFHPVIKETDLTKRTQISIFAVDWEQFLRDLDTQ